MSEALLIAIIVLSVVLGGFLIGGSIGLVIFLRNKSKLSHVMQLQAKEANAIGAEIGFSSSTTTWEESHRALQRGATLKRPEPSPAKRFNGRIETEQESNANNNNNSSQLYNSFQEGSVLGITPRGPYTSFAHPTPLAEEAAGGTTATMNSEDNNSNGGTNSARGGGGKHVRFPSFDDKKNNAHDAVKNNNSNVNDATTAKGLSPVDAPWAPLLFSRNAAAEERERDLRNASTALPSPILEQTRKKLLASMPQVPPLSSSGSFSHASTPENLKRSPRSPIPVSAVDLRLLEREKQAHDNMLAHVAESKKKPFASPPLPGASMSNQSSSSSSSQSTFYGPLNMMLPKMHQERQSGSVSTMGGHSTILDTRAGSLMMPSSFLPVETHVVLPQLEQEQGKQHETVGESNDMSSAPAAAATEKTKVEFTPLGVHDSNRTFWSIYKPKVNATPEKRTPVKLEVDELGDLVRRAIAASPTLSLANTPPSEPPKAMSWRRSNENDSSNNNNNNVARNLNMEMGIDRNVGTSTPIKGGGGGDTARMYVEPTPRMPAPMTIGMRLGLDSATVERIMKEEEAKKQGMNNGESNVVVMTAADRASAMSTPPIVPTMTIANLNAQTSEYSAAYDTNASAASGFGSEMFNNAERDPDANFVTLDEEGGVEVELGPRGFNIARPRQKARRRAPEYKAPGEKKTSSSLVPTWVTSWIGGEEEKPVIIQG